MANSTHTPGPWILSTIDGVEDSLMAGGGDGSEVVADIRIHWDAATVEANARLIASAPDLLQALRVLAGFAAAHGGDILVKEHLKLARAAIEKATGDSANSPTVDDRYVYIDDDGTQH